MAETETYEDFLSQYAPLIDDLAKAGWTPAEAYARFTTLFPAVARDHIARAIETGEWTFVGRKEHLLNNTMTTAALWYAVAVTYDLEADPEYTAISLDRVILQDIPRLFESSGVPAETIAVLLGRMGAGLKYLAENPYASLDESTYDEFLENLPEEATDISDDVVSWPPSRFTIEDRLGDGSWATAMLRVGICPPEIDDLALNLSAAAVSDRSFRNALGEFLSYCIRYDRKPTVLLYGSWAVARPQLGRVPLLGAVRGKYGSWNRALKLGRRMVNDALKMSSASAVPASSSHENSAESLRIEDLNAQGIGVVQTPTMTPEERQHKAWHDLSSVLISRLQELPWSQSLRVYYLSPEAVEAEEYTPFVRILRSPAGYLCELASVEEFIALPPTVDEDFLAERGWLKSRTDSFTGWSQNFFDVVDAATQLLDAMRTGMGCERPDYFQSDDHSNSPEVDVVNPSTGSVPMVLAPTRSTVSIETD